MDTVKHPIAIPRKRKGDLPYVLTIAGMDPTGGAGLLADIKTLHHHGVYGLGIISCNTVQTDKVFGEVIWMAPAFILRSVASLGQRFAIQVVKIGALKDLSMLEALLDAISKFMPEARIVWDPVLKSSTGGHFFSLTEADLTGKNASAWVRALQRICVITPNAQEAVIIGQLAGVTRPAAISPIKKGVNLKEVDPLLRVVSRFTAVLLKGGHLTGSAPIDRLYVWDEKSKLAKVYTTPLIAVSGETLSAKHGSGCVHSSTLAAGLAKGYSLITCLQQTKAYMDLFLQSSRSLLGIHK